MSPWEQLKRRGEKDDQHAENVFQNCNNMLIPWNIYFFILCLLFYHYFVHLLPPLNFKPIGSRALNNCLHLYNNQNLNSNISRTQKHAYLIVAHNHFDHLLLLIQLLDDKANDIYIHIDKEVNFPPEKVFKQSAQESNIYFVPSLSVKWGGFSQIRTEILLLKTSLPKHYFYYHLLSGVDLPLHSQNYIHKFFRKNTGKEYVDIKDTLVPLWVQRLSHYHIGIGGHDCAPYIFDSTGIDRIGKKREYFYKGSNWFSITHCLASYTLTQQRFINHYFWFSACGDEEFLQAITQNSVFVIFNQKVDMRMIDWIRGTPYTYSDEDFSELIDSNKLFARKFNISRNPTLVENLFNTIYQKENRDILNRS